MKDIIFNAMLDWRKKDIDKVERAKIIKQYMKDEKITIRDLAKELGIPKSTLDNWLLFARVSKEKIEELEEQGLGDTEIFRALRKTRTTSKEDIETSIEYDVEFERVLRKINFALKEDRLTKNTLKLAKDLRDKLDVLIEKFERKRILN